MPHDSNEPLAGKHDDFIAEFARNSRRIYGYIRALVPDRNDANDVYQAASLVMWRKFDAFELGTNFYAWGCHIALFEIRQLRDSKKRTHILSDEAIDALHAELADRRDNASSRLAALSQCIEKLEPESKWLVEQRYFQERDVRDISLELNRSVASVYRAITRTHCWLLACIQRTLHDGV